ncbi:MAG: 1,4-alpha-glucan branching protein GlgB [Oscillospiraceae bacterium]|nr:1,4-alpha-glucan branching protein GlgB [Oscillospiraceae bacterium]
MELKELIERYVSNDDIWLYNTGNARRAYHALGCRYIPECGMHRFAVWAPHAREVSVVGDFNGWDGYAHPMWRRDDEIWVTFIPGLKNGDIYKFRVVGEDWNTVLKADPFAFHAETGPATGSKIWDIEGYDWTDSDYMEKRRGKDSVHAPMSIYEMHMGSWRKKDGEVFPNYRRVADELVEYLKYMHYTHVELLPITEYPYDGSWGYQVTGFFAPTSRYGTPQDFMYFVDKLHSEGIGVIIDWVPAHFPRDEHGLRMFDGAPCYECSEQRMAEHPDWGTMIFDYSRPQVQSFLTSSAVFFFDKYHVDGIRVDAVSSMLYLDYGRKFGEWTPNKDGGNINLGAVDFLRKLNSAVLTEYPGAITIAEESTAFPLVSRPPEVGGLGFVFKWDMGFMHDTLDYMAIDPYFRSYNHSRLTFSMMYAFSENFVLAFSHDEVVHGKASMVNKMWGDYETKFASLRALYGYQFAHPGTKLMFMGGEFAQFIEWNYLQQLDWSLLEYPLHDGMRKYVRELGRLYASTPALWKVDDSWDGFSWLNVDDSERSSVAFMRMSQRSYIVCALNFTPVRYDDFTIGLPKPGVLKELINSDDTQYGGSGILNKAEIESADESFLDHPCSAKITLPPMSAVWFRFTPTSAKKLKELEAQKAKAAKKKAPARKKK